MAVNAEQFRQEREAKLAGDIPMNYREIENFHNIRAQLGDTSIDSLASREAAIYFDAAVRVLSVPEVTNVAKVSGIKPVHRGILASITLDSGENLLVELTGYGLSNNNPRGDYGIATRCWTGENAQADYHMTVGQKFMQLGEVESNFKLHARYRTASGWSKAEEIATDRRSAERFGYADVIVKLLNCFAHIM